MKKIIGFIMLVVGLSFSTQVFAQDNITVYLNGEKMNFEREPQIVKGSVYVPMRDVFEALGADVEWRSEDKSIIVTKDLDIYVFSSDSNYYTKNEKQKQFSSLTIPFIDAGKTFVPIRAVAESLGADVEWDNAKRRITISMKPITDKKGELSEYEEKLLNNRYYLTNEITYDGILKEFQEYGAKEGYKIVSDRSKVYNFECIRFYADFFGERVLYEFVFSEGKVLFLDIIFEEENEKEARKVATNLNAIFEENFGVPSTAIDTESTKYDQFVLYTTWKRNNRYYTVDFSKFPSLKFEVTLQV